MTGTDVAVIVAAFVWLLIVLDMVLGDRVDRWLTGRERYDARRRNRR